MKTLQPSPAWQPQVSSRQQLQQPGQETTACASIATSTACIIYATSRLAAGPFGRSTDTAGRNNTHHCCHVQVGGLMPVLYAMLGSRLNCKR